MPVRDTFPPCPDPERYTLIKTKEGQFWRLKKGLKRPAILHRNGLFNKIITQLRGGWTRSGLMHPALLRDLGLQKDYPLRRLLRSGFQWRHDIDSHVFSFRIDIPERNGALLRQSKLMTGYRFTILLVHGRPEAEGDLQLKSVASKDYPFAGTGKADECLLELPYTPQPGQWLFCLRAECLEGGKVASHPKSRALQVLDGGKWE